MSGRRAHAALPVLLVAVAAVEGMEFARQPLAAQDAARPTVAAPSYEHHFDYLGNSLSEAAPGWHANTQGITHDRENFYFTQSSRIWRVPASTDFDVTPFVSENNFLFRDLDDLPLRGYNHFGAPTYYDPPAQFGVVLVPVTGGPVPLIVALNPLTKLSFAASAPLPQDDAGWAAVDPTTGRLYSSDKHARAIIRYEVDWTRLRLSGDLVLNTNSRITIPLLEEDGSPIEAMRHMQGGAFSTDGKLLYLVSGFSVGTFSTDDTPVAEMRANGGIHVFDTRTWRRVGNSTQDEGLFRYEFHPQCNLLDFPCEEPQGLTIWDLAEGYHVNDDDSRTRTPLVRGQMHVLMLDNNSRDEADRIYLKHYTNTVYLGRWPGLPSQFQRYDRLSAAVDAAWNGSQIKVKAGAYPGAMSIAKQIRLIVDGGTAVLGGR